MYHKDKFKSGLRKRGSTILLTIVGFLIISILLASIGKVVRFTMQSAERRNLDLVARLLAEEALEDAFWNIRKEELTGANWTAGVTTPNNNGSGDETLYTRTQANISRSDRNATVWQEVNEKTYVVNGKTSYVYDVTVSVDVEGGFSTTASDSFSLEVQKLSSLPELAGMRMMNNDRSPWKLDQVGSYDSSIDPIFGTMLYSYEASDSDALGNFYAASSLQDASNPGFNLLASYEPLDIFIGDWGHAKLGTSLPYLSYYSRDLSGGLSQSDPINVYYARRFDVERHQNSTLMPGDGKTFFDFVTGADESQAEQALQLVTNTTNYNNLNTDAKILDFQEELASNPNYQPDPAQYNFIEVAGKSADKLPFDGTYIGDSYVAGSFHLNSANATLHINKANSEQTPQGVPEASISNNNGVVTISGGNVATGEAAIITMTNSNAVDSIVIAPDSNIILYVEEPVVSLRKLEVANGGKLLVHLSPDTVSFAASALAAAHSGIPMDLTIIDEPKEVDLLDENGTVVGSYYDGTDIALGDPYREYQPYKALNLDNANHPTVATVYAPFSTVYTDHFAGALVADHYQTHGVILVDRNTMANSPYLQKYITNDEAIFEIVSIDRTY